MPIVPSDTPASHFVQDAHGNMLNAGSATTAQAIVAERPELRLCTSGRVRFDSGEHARFAEDMREVLSADYQTLEERAARIARSIIDNPQASGTSTGRMASGPWPFQDMPRIRGRAADVCIMDDMAAEWDRTDAIEATLSGWWHGIAIGLVTGTGLGLMLARAL